MVGIQASRRNTELGEVGVIIEALEACLLLRRIDTPTHETEGVSHAGARRPSHGRGSRDLAYQRGVRLTVLERATVLF